MQVELAVEAANKDHKQDKEHLKLVAAHAMQVCADCPSRFTTGVCLY